jgi:hypothetical protein
VESDFLKNIKLTPASIEALDRLLEAAPPDELRENILEIYHTYMIHAHHTLPMDFEKLSMNMYLLINCLGTIANERRK